MPEIKSFEFNLKTKTKFGAKEALKLGEYLKDLKFKKIGLIVDSGLVQTDYFQEILENLKKENFEKIKVWQYDLKGEPDYDSLNRVKLEFLDESAKPIVDCFVGIGGGSTIDFAKALATVTVNPGESRKYKGFPTDIEIPLPVIALPTTAGTGSEVTFNASLIDWKAKKKMGINSTYNYPVLAILDPALTLSCPKWVIASSGMDALVHAIESYASLKSNILSRIFAKEAFKLIFNNLAKVLDQPNDLEIKANLQLGAYLAGISIINSGGGPTGGLSYPLGVHFKVPHGLAGGVFLPHIVEYNAKNGYDYSELYDLIEGTDKSLNREKKTQLFSEKFSELCHQKLGVPSSLKGFGVNEKNVHLLTDEIGEYEGSFQQNPIPFSVEEGKRLIIKLISNN